MARTKKKYQCGRDRGGIPGVAVDSSFGAPGNKRKSKHDYSKNVAAAGRQKRT